MLETLRERLLSVQQDFTSGWVYGGGREGAGGRGLRTPPPSPPRTRCAPAPSGTSHPRPAEQSHELSGVGPAALSNLEPSQPAPRSARRTPGPRPGVWAAAGGGHVVGGAPPASAARGTGARAPSASGACEAPARPGLGLLGRAGTEGHGRPVSALRSGPPAEPPAPARRPFLLFSLAAFAPGSARW